MPPPTTKVAFQGHKGAYSEGAALQLFTSQSCFTKTPVETVGVETFEKIFAAVQNGDYEYGIIPIENSSTGTFHANFDLLRQHDLHIVGEYLYHEKHCLVALPGVTLDQITEVGSHPYVIDQCRQFLTSLDNTSIVINQTTDTAGCAKAIRERNLKTSAAIAGQRAAELYSLQVLRSGIEDDPNTMTRYILISKTPIVPERHLEPRTSVSVMLKNQVGSFHKAIAAFALRDVNLHKIESRPSARSTQLSKPWEYLLYIDIDGSTADAPVQNAIRHLEEFAVHVRVLGSYPRYQPPIERPLGAIGIGM